VYTAFTACCLHKDHNITSSIREMSLSSQFNSFKLHLQGWMILHCKKSRQEIDTSISKLHFVVMSTEYPDNTRKSRQKKFLAWQVSRGGMSQFLNSLKQCSILLLSQ